MDICTHERRPGTTVCLHCRHAARVAARSQRKRVVLRATAIFAAVAAVSAGGVLGAVALSGRRGPARAPNQPLAEAPASADAHGSPSLTNEASAATVEQAGTVASVGSPLSPVIPAGTTIIADGVSADRVDSTVTLSFDAPMTRTRIPEKFERFLRTTLEQVYGRSVDSVLAKVPAGSIVATQGALLYELPTRGIHIPLQDAWQLAIYPEIRPGQDGPLVVRYRVAVVTSEND
jgi:hypothetical protein